jgi:hypothetical protein
MFFQLILTTAIWTVGFVVNAIRNFPKFYPLPMLGGFLWSTGNLNTVPIIKLIGIGMGTLFWNTILLIFGWAIARFGWFGVKPEIPSETTLNYIGVLLAAASGIFYLFVKSETRTNVVEDREQLIYDPAVSSSSTENFSNINSSNAINTTSASVVNNQNTFFDNLNPSTKRVFGTCMACLSGVLYAFTFTPALYVQDNYEQASQNALDYVFSLYTGIYLSSIMYFTIYCIIKKSKPQVFPRVILPALVSGKFFLYLAKFNLIYDILINL